MIWSGTEEELKQFTQEVNSLRDSTKFTVEYSKKEITFLDTTVTINESKLLTKLYKKPTDRSAYLHNQSYHPNHLKKNIPYGQAIRIKRFCSQNEDYQTALHEMKEAFIKRGYQKEQAS